MALLEEEQEQEQEQETNKLKTKNLFAADYTKRYPYTA
jgi:hypothetical protein